MLTWGRGTSESLSALIEREDVQESLTEDSFF